MRHPDLATRICSARAAIRRASRGDLPPQAREREEATCASWSPTTTASTRRASKVCEEIARALSDDVWVVAPEIRPVRRVAFALAQRSAAAARGRRAAFRREGHADRLRHHGRAPIMNDKPPDLVLSGVNRGRNVAEDVIYSGTVAGAMEGAVLGIPSFALSQAYAPRATQNAVLGHRAQARARHHPPRARRGHPARRAGQHQFSRLRAGRGEGHRGRRARASATRNCCASSARHDGRGNPYYWIAFARGARRRGRTAATRRRSPTSASR